MGSKHVTAAKLDDEPDRGEIEQVEHGTLKPSKLFSNAQEALVVDELPHASSLNDLAVLGPVDARKWDLPPETFPHKLSVEEWSLPGGPHFIELSFKVTPDKAENAKRTFHSLLDHLNIGHDGDPDPKTPRVLNLLAERLRSSSSGRYGRCYRLVENPRTRFVRCSRAGAGGAGGVRPRERVAASPCRVYQRPSPALLTLETSERP